jgi:hypothetical protein
MGMMFVFVPLICLCAAVANGVAASRFRRGELQWAWAASALNISLFPVGTVGGLIGLGLLSNKQFRKVPPIDPRTQPLDGVGPMKRRLFALAPVVLAATLTVLNLQWAKLASLPEVSLLAWLGWTELAILTASFVHELGHLICAKLSDFKLMSFVVGPLHFEKRVHGWRFRFVPKGLLRLGGQCGIVPTHMSDINSRALFVAAGGPIASIFVGVAATILFFSCPHTPWASAWPFLESVMVVGWMQAVANLIPFPTSTGYSDSARMNQLRKPGLCEQILARSVVSLSLPTALRPRDWNTELIERAALYDNGVHEQVPFFIYAYEMHSDRGNNEEAASWMKLAISFCRDPQMRWSKKFAPAFAFHEGFEKKNAVRARNWLTIAYRDNSADWYSAEAAVLHAEGDVKGARKAWERAVAEARKSPQTGAYNCERDRLAVMGKVCFNAAA